MRVQNSWFGPCLAGEHWVSERLKCKDSRLEPRSPHAQAAGSHWQGGVWQTLGAVTDLSELRFLSVGHSWLSLRLSPEHSGGFCFSFLLLPKPIVEKWTERAEIRSFNYSELRKIKKLRGTLAFSNSSHRSSKGGKTWVRWQEIPQLVALLSQCSQPLLKVW